MRHEPSLASARTPVAEVLADASPPTSTATPVLADEHDVSPLDRQRICDWCPGPIRPDSRCDAITCSKSCRQAYVSPLQDRRVDALVHVARARTTDPHRVIGAKPAAFCYWLFDLLGALPGDDFVDLFPGSGGVARAWCFYASPGAGETRRVALRSSAGDPS